MLQIVVDKNRQTFDVIESRSIIQIMQLDKDK